MLHRFNACDTQLCLAENIDENRIFNRVEQRVMSGSASGRRQLRAEERTSFYCHAARNFLAAVEYFLLYCRNNPLTVLDLP
jgi:hypothetical protein